MRCPIQVISLETSLERRRVFIANNPHIAFEFFNAVDGFLLSPEEIRDPLRFVQPLHYSAGAYGCALSHRNLWERALHLDAPLTIAEDDALFRWDFEQRIKDVFDRMPTEWDIILWGWNFDSILSLQGPLAPAYHRTLMPSTHPRRISPPLVVLICTQGRTRW